MQMHVEMWKYVAIKMNGFYISAQSMKIFIEDFFNQFVQIHRKMRIWSYLLKKFLMENFIFCPVYETHHWAKMC